MLSRRGNSFSSNSSPDNALLARHVAHELNSQLDGALRTLRAVRRDSASTSTFDDRLAAIERSLVAMMSTVERAMREDSTAHGALLFTSDQTLGNTLREMLRTYRSLAEDFGVAVRVECEADAGALTVGPLEPLFANAIRNAIEASGEAPRDEAPHVTISVRRRGARLMVDIVDNGPGVDETRARKPHGHGIGLDVARRIAGSIGGTVELSNIPFGRGAIFRAEIPVAELVRRDAA
ncbi:MAG: sensor histidine kinase [Phycisphaerae bacterium]|nr:sensor histidine kinase [Phycisphaerae bacterium]